jgi:thiosulfate/3-mercaptopyruvate sulfurtransferase
VYCGGVSATLLALGLVRAGREDVRIYDGSLEEWTADPARVVEASAVS